MPAAPAYGASGGLVPANGAIPFGSQVFGGGGIGGAAAGRGGSFTLAAGARPGVAGLASLTAAFPFVNKQAFVNAGAQAMSQHSQPMKMQNASGGGGGGGGGGSGKGVKRRRVDAERPLSELFTVRSTRVLNSHQVALIMDHLALNNRVLGNQTRLIKGIFGEMVFRARGRVINKKIRKMLQRTWREFDERYLAVATLLGVVVVVLEPHDDLVMVPRVYPPELVTPQFVIAEETGRYIWRAMISDANGGGGGGLHELPGAIVFAPFLPDALGNLRSPCARLIDCMLWRQGKLADDRFVSSEHARPWFVLSREQDRGPLVAIGRNGAGGPGLGLPPPRGDLRNPAAGSLADTARLPIAITPAPGVLQPRRKASFRCVPPLRAAPKPPWG